MLTIPLRVEVHDEQGAVVETEAKTVLLNRFGARIESASPLESGQTVRLVNPVDHRHAEFRVVGPAASSEGAATQWGLECLEAGENFWGIEFPPPVTGEPADAKALLECRICSTRALLPLSLSGVEVLQTIGVATHFCSKCGVFTPWRKLEKQMVKSPDSGAAESAAVEWSPERRHRRMCLQLPVGIRDGHGEVEIVRTEDISRGGFCFASQRHYSVGQVVTVLVPRSPVVTTVEVSARVVRQQPLEGSPRRIYGVQFIPSKN